MKRLLLAQGNKPSTPLATGALEKAFLSSQVKLFSHLPIEVIVTRYKSYRYLVTFLTFNPEEATNAETSRVKFRVFPVLCLFIFLSSVLLPNYSNSVVSDGCKTYGHVCQPSMVAKTNYTTVQSKLLKL